MTDAPSQPALHSLPFDLADQSFLPGDTITITDIRSTADTIAPGNQYEIHGTYTLASADSALLAAFVTATDPKDASGPVTEKHQELTVTKGTANFTLILPFTINGSPHVSLYVHGSSSCVYFQNKQPTALILISPTALTLDGQPTTWDALPALLQKIPTPEKTTLAFALTTDQMTIAAHNDAATRITTLAHQYHFLRTHDTGIQAPAKP